MIEFFNLAAQAVEKFFHSLQNVPPTLNAKDRLDFSINGVTFDHKTSFFLKNFPYPIKEALKKTSKPFLMESGQFVNIIIKDNSSYYESICDYKYLRYNNCFTMFHPPIKTN